MGNPASDAEVMSRLSASSGLDKIRAKTPGAEPPPEPEPEIEPAAEAPAAEASDAGEGEPEQPTQTAPEKDEFDLDSGLPDAPADQEQEQGEPEPEPEAEPESEPEPEDGEQRPADKQTLRSQLKNFATQAKTLTAEKATLTKRVSELEAQLKDSPNAKALSEALSKKEAEIAELQKQISYIDYTQSPEFKERYEAPYKGKLTEAFKELQTLNKEDGSKLSEAEIESLVLGGEREAYRMIEDSMTGADARLASRLVSEVYGLSRDKERAMANAKQESVARTKEQQAQRAQFRERYRAMFNQNKDAIKQKYPDAYVPDPKDKDRAALFEAGYQLVESAFDPNNKASPDQRARIEAEIYHRAGAFPAMRHRAMTAEKALDEARKELSKYKRSAPGKGQPGTEEGGSVGPKGEVGSKEWVASRLRESQRRG